MCVVLPTPQSSQTVLFLAVLHSDPWHSSSLGKVSTFGADALLIEAVLSAYAAKMQTQSFESARENGRGLSGSSSLARGLSVVGGPFYVLHSMICGAPRLRTSFEGQILALSHC